LNDEWWKAKQRSVTAMKILDFKHRENVIKGRGIIEDWLHIFFNLVSGLMIVNCPRSDDFKLGK
jgi:hypothetical protein